MVLLLFAQEQIARVTWVDEWASSASVVGFGLSAVGFFFTFLAFCKTWRNQSEIRRTNQETLRKVAFTLLVAGVGGMK